MENIKEIRTICVNCKHYSNVPTIPVTRPDEIPAMFRDHYCLASPLEEFVDPVTGKVQYKQRDQEEGKFYFTWQKFDYCRNVNTDGNCPKYEKARESDS